jgi:tRNA-dihydrouridine synthase
MLKMTGADKVMAGRALAARPWMMWQLGEDLGFETPAAFTGLRAPRTADEEGREYGRMLLRFIDHCENSFMIEAGVSESVTLRKIQFFIKTTHVWLEFGHALMAKASGCRDLKTLRAAVAEFFLVDQRMNAKTELRQ